SLIAILGTLFALAYKRVHPKIKNAEWQAYLSNLANSGASILGMHLIYLLLNGARPQLDASGTYITVFSITVAFLGSSLISILFVSFVQDISFEEIILDANKYLI